MPPKYTDQFRIDVVKQVVENGYGVLETADRLGIHQTSLSSWIKKYKLPEAMAQAKISENASAEIKRLQKELQKNEIY